MTAVKQKSITVTKIKITTKAVHLKWKITWLHLICYGAGISKQKKEKKKKNPEAMCVSCACDPDQAFKQSANCEFISQSS